MKFKTVYTLRFLPLFVGLLLLIVSAVLEYGTPADAGDMLIGSFFLTLFGVIFYRGVLQHKREKEQEAEAIKNPPPPPTETELQQAKRDEIDDGIKLHTSNIIIRSFMILLSLLTLVAAVNIFIIGEQQYLIGGLIAIFSIGVLIYSFYTLRTWIRCLKHFKEERKKSKK